MTDNNVENGNHFGKNQDDSFQQNQKQNHNDKKKTFLDLNKTNTLKDEQNTVLYYQETLSANPNNLTANVNLYKYFFYNKQPKKAIYYIKKAIEIDSENEERHLPFLITALQTYDLKEAFSTAEQFYKKYKSNPLIAAI